MSDVFEHTLGRQLCYNCSEFKPKLLAVAKVRAGPRPVGKCCLCLPSASEVPTTEVAGVIRHDALQ